MRSTALLVAGTCLSMLSVVACGDTTEPVETRVVTPKAAALQIVSGDGQSWFQGLALPQPLVVRVFDQFGDPFAGAEVAWEVLQPNIVLSDDLSITDASGLAETSVTLAKRSGPVAVTARLVGVPGEQISFSLISQATPTITDTIPANSPDTLMLTVANGARLVIPPGSFSNPTEVRLSEAPTGTSGSEGIAAVDVSIRQLSGPGAPSVAGGAAVLEKFFIAFEASFVPEVIDAVWVFAVTDPVGFLAETVVDVELQLLRAILNVVPSLQFRAEYVRYDEPSCDRNYELRLREEQSSRGVTVVLVHGFQPRMLDCDAYDSDVAANTFSRIIERNSGVWLDRPYHNLATFTYPSYNSPESAARKLAAALESETALRPIIMLGHSMGGLVSRRAAQLLSQSGVDIRGIVTLGTPHYGTELATRKLPFDKPTQMAACVGAQLATTPAAEKAERAGVITEILQLGLFAFLGTSGDRALAPDSPFLDVLNDTPISAHRTIGFAGDISQSHLGSSDLVTAVGHCALKLEWGYERTDGIVPLLSALRSGMEATYEKPGYDHFGLPSGVGVEGADAVYFEQLRSAVLNVSPSWVDGRVTSADGTGYAGAVVRLLDSVDDLDLAPPATTDADGNYAFDLVEPGSYRLLLENTGGLDSEPLTPHAASLEAGQIERIDFLLSEQTPDLTISASVAASYSSGQTDVAIPVTVSRSGGDLTLGTYATARLYWSTDPVLSEAFDTQLWESDGNTPDYPNAVLNFAGSQTVTAVVDIPTGMGPPIGFDAWPNYVLVVVDPTDFHPESNEDNNVAAYMVMLRVAPVITGVSPNPVTGSDSPQPFTINGWRFLSGANVTLRDLTNDETFPNREASSVSSTEIVLNPVFTTSAADWSVEVINPDGLSSGQFEFQVVPPLPSVDLYASSGSRGIFGSRGPSDLYVVQPSEDGEDVLIGRIRTSTGFEPVITDVALSPSGSLFGISFEMLYSIRRSDALAVPVGELGITGANALGFDQHGNLFGATENGTFFRVSTTSGEATPIGSWGPDTESQGDIAFAQDGRLFGTARTETLSSVLVLIDPNTGQATPIDMEIPIGFENVWGLAFAASDLFGLTTDASSATGQLIRIDPVSGAGTFVRDLTFDAFGAGAPRRVERNR